MDIQQLDLTNDRLVLEVLAIHCTYPMEWGGVDELDENSVAVNLSRLASGLPTSIFYCSDYGRIIGLHWVEVPIRRKGNIRSLWVDPGYRGQGLAKQLKRAGEEWFLQHHVERIETRINRNNVAMESLNRLFGYSKQGVVYVKQLALATQ